MYIKAEWILILVLLAFGAFHYLKMNEAKSAATALTDNEEHWSWTDYRGFVYEIGVTRHVH